MKKIMILAVAAIALVACSKTFEQGNRSFEGKAISFSTWSQTLTRARATANDDTAFADKDSFNVYGFKHVEADHVVFDGDIVRASVSGSTVSWDYDTHRFWDPAADSYTFFAVLPAEILAAEANAGDYATTGLFTSDNFTFDDPTGMGNDILVANKELVEGTGASAPYSYSNAVEMKFNHIASRVDLLVKQDDKLGNATVKVTALSLLKISNKGSFAVSAYDNTTKAPTVAWTEATPATTLGTAGVYQILDSADAGDDVTVADTTAYAADHSVSSTTGHPDTLFVDYVFMPQDLVADTQQIKISYTIQVGSEEPNVYNDVIIDICDFKTIDSNDDSLGTAITSWDPKTKYVYTLTIGANIIEFTASVNEWENTMSGYHYLIN